MNRSELAKEKFLSGFTCSQAVFSTYSTELGLDEKNAAKIACPFGGGLGSLGHVCGAVTGALMLIGLKYGSSEPKDKESKANAYSKVREFVKKFEERNKTIICKELLDCDISTPEGRKYAEENGLFKKVCPKFVKDAAEIIEEMLFKKE
ncbi:C_GCAxxG_C_C family protein [Caldicellulosiruptor kronotskyensis 2002]|uniref:C_GCAxxG_C_C family protein n=1 Tax=Caldicellulosiruptor kronotskyensis (strain DSM 18902 / VKM B-2412 / 2002) TaxID=632348 RepID=E4SF09_CALK2|nr:C-GCAxxG-C-C family protein [Caldicellulosiruptor kronotskyensis]ADQ45646.1 C_GCAxxG_C_C family protein [Caldicellulosiruptor kronotskyensis 2002]